MSLRVIIDARPLVGERTGIGVHTAEIASRLDSDLQPLLASHAPIDDLDGIEALDRRVDRKPLGVIWQQTMLPRVLEEEEGDLLWGPHGTLPLRLSAPSVVTLHDLTSITMPRAHRLKTVLSFNTIISQSLSRATRIMAVSRHTADAAIRGFAVDASRVEIVPNGVSEFFSPGEPPESDPFILYVGSIEPRKGIGDLVEAWRSIPGAPRLVLAGASGWKNDDLQRKVRAQIERREITVTGFVSREKLRELYRSATVFVYPSHFEGFGLPVLEAMACGAPVITTTGGAIPEAAGDAAVLVEPGDVDGLASALRQLLASSERRQELRERGIERARHFSWATSAKRASEIFRMVGAR